MYTASEQRLYNDGYLGSVDGRADDLGVGVEAGVLEDVDLVVLIEGRCIPKPRY